MLNLYRYAIFHAMKPCVKKFSSDLKQSIDFYDVHTTCNFATQKISLFRYYNCNSSQSQSILITILITIITTDICDKDLRSIIVDLIADVWRKKKKLLLCSHVHVKDEYIENSTAPLININVSFYCQILYWPSTDQCFQTLMKPLSNCPLFYVINVYGHIL